MRFMTNYSGGLYSWRKLLAESGSDISPTQSVGGEPRDKLEKVQHSSDMRSFGFSDIKKLSGKKEKGPGLLQS